MVGQVQIPNWAVPTHHIYAAKLSCAGSQESSDPANEQKDETIKAYLTIGRLLQRRHTLHLFLTDKRIVKDTKSIIEAIVGMVQAWVAQKLLKSNIFTTV